MTEPSANYVPVDKLHVQELLDPDILMSHVDNGLIRRTLNADGYALFNYTERAQWSRSWDAQTLTCRGLVLDPDGYVQSRPFPKFFNLNEHESPDLPDLPIEPFSVYEKLDGSLIVASTLPSGDVLMTTRGSFESSQAIAAKRLWQERHADVEIPVGETWCFEFIAPWNKIVVDYGQREELVLLGRLGNRTGSDLPTYDWGGPVARCFDGLNDFEQVRAMMATLPSTEEGYVLRFESGLRAKAKGSEYVRLHKLLTGVSAKTVWECLANGNDLADMLDRVPDEFAQWVKDQAATITSAFSAIEHEAMSQHEAIHGLPSRKHQAIAIAGYKHKGVVFALLDGKDHARSIWRAVKPEKELPFVLDPDCGQPIDSTVVSGSFQSPGEPGDKS